MSRDRTVCMMRIRNEARWLGRNLERTWQVCSKVVLWDDGSTDLTEFVASESLKEDKTRRCPVSGQGGLIYTGTTPYGPAELHFLRSPYAEVVRPKERRNELRDKCCLWWYVKAAVDFQYVLCLDGDEMLSKKALAIMPDVWRHLDVACDWIACPIVYLWDSETQRRVDGIYGNSTDNIARLRFPRMFTIRRLDEQQLYDTKFNWQGTRGGLHCGSIPQDGFQDIKPGSLTIAQMEIIHFGYLEEAMRQEKFKLYNSIDPENDFEGRYLHVIGQPNVHAPGPVKVIPWEDV